MIFTVVIPIYQLDLDRKKNLEFIYNRLITHYHENEIEIIFGIQDSCIDSYYKIFDRAKILHCSYSVSTDFNKSYIFNKCCEHGINGKFLIFLDTDVYFPFEKLKTQLTCLDLVVRPFDECIFLDENNTHEFINNKKIVTNGKFKRVSATGGGCIILNKKILSQVRMDENFTGWGWEDIDLGNALSKKFQIKILSQKAVHLYHKPSPINKNNQSYYNNKYKYKHQPYNINLKKDIEIIIPYFSINDDEKIKSDFYRTLDSLIHTQCPITVVEAIFTKNYPLKKLAKKINHIQLSINTNNILFLKENLCNIGIKNTKKNKLLFLDSNLLFSNTNFIDESSTLLDEYDVIQPFESYILTDKNNIPLLDYNFKYSIVKAIVHNKEIDIVEHNTGFAWGMTRKFAQYCGGFYDRNPSDSSSISFGYGICDKDQVFKNSIEYYKKTNQLFINTPSYKSYKENIKNYNPRIGFLKNCICYHSFHNSKTAMNHYDKNHIYLIPLINNEYPLVYKNDLLEWVHNDDAMRSLEYLQNSQKD